MLGYCGINCDNCRAYKGTVNGDASLLEAAATSFGGVAKDWVCLGCQPVDQQFLAKSCSECKIRKCAIAKGISNCAACDDYEGCEQLHKFVGSDTSAWAKTMNMLRERFVDSHCCGRS